MSSGRISRGKKSDPKQGDRDTGPFFSIPPAPMLFFFPNRPIIYREENHHCAFVPVTDTEQGSVWKQEGWKRLYADGKTNRDFVRVGYQ